MKIDIVFLGIKQNKQDNLFKHLPKSDESKKLILLHKHFTISVDSYVSVKDALRAFKTTALIDFQKSWYEKFGNLQQSINLAASLFKKSIVTNSSIVNTSLADYLGHDTQGQPYLDLCFTITASTDLDIQEKFSYLEMSEDTYRLVNYSESNLIGEAK